MSFQTCNLRKHWHTCSATLAAFVLAVLTLGLLLGGCGGTDNNAPPEALAGIATMAITGTTGVSSVQIDFTNGTRSDSRCIVVDGQTTTTLDRLPTGSAVVVNGAAFADNACGGTATWFAEPQTVPMAPGQATRITIRFRPNGVGQVEVNWLPDEPTTTFGCASDWQRVPREAMALESSGPGGMGLRATYDDGDVRIEGPLSFGPYDAGNVPSHYPADVLADSTAPTLWQTIWGIGGETLTGYIIAPRSGEVSFAVSADDYASLALGEAGSTLSLLADNTGWAEGTAMLEAGRYYSVSIRYVNRWGSNWFHFYWACSSASAQ